MSDVKSYLINKRSFLFRKTNDINFRIDTLKN